MKDLEVIVFEKELLEGDMEYLMLEKRDAWSRIEENNRRDALLGEDIKKAIKNKEYLEGEMLPVFWEEIESLLNDALGCQEDRQKKLDSLRDIKRREMECRACWQAVVVRMERLKGEQLELRNENLEMYERLNRCDERLWEKERKKLDLEIVESQIAGKV